MAAPVAAAVVMAAAAIYQGISSSAASKRQARQAEEWAAYNAEIARRVGSVNAQATADMAKLNASLVMMGAATEAAIARSVAKYNSGIRLQLAEYNAQQIESEIPLIWDQAELDIFNLGQQIDVISGANRAAFGASGVALDIGTPMDVEIDLRTQEALEVAAIRHNALISTSRLVDAAAQSRWEGMVEAGQIIYEGNVNSALSLSRGGIQAAGITAQGLYDAAIGRYNTSINAGQTLYQGSYAADFYDDQATKAYVDMSFKLGSIAATSYAENYHPTSQTPMYGYSPAALYKQNPAAYRAISGYGTSVIK